MSDDKGANCIRCSETLPADNGYCMSCGFQNTDIEAKKYGLLQQSQGRVDRARMLSKFYRLSWLLRFFR